MDLRDKRILLISPEPWEGLHMSKHHLAQGLAARDNDVVFLGPPDPKARTIEVKQCDGLRVIKYRHWLKGVNSLPRPLHMWYYGRLLQRVADRTGGAFDMLWNFDTSRMQWFPKDMGYRLLHLADYNILHQGMGLVHTSDIVLATGEVVKEHVERITGVRVYNVGHAIDERWLHGSDKLHIRTPGPPKRVVYAGQLAMHYHDWEGWLDLARSHPELDFTFIGPFDPQLPETDFHALRALPHVSFVGLMPKESLIPVLREADILLFGFRSATLAKERANPHKVLEYLSTGNVIVGSWTMEYADKPGLMCMAEQGAPLLPTFDHALASFNELNNPDERRKRIDFARERGMSAMLDGLEMLLRTA